MSRVKRAQLRQLKWKSSSYAAFLEAPVSELGSSKSPPPGRLLPFLTSSCTIYLIQKCDNVPHQGWECVHMEKLNLNSFLCSSSGLNRLIFVHAGTVCSSGKSNLGNLPCKNHWESSPAKQNKWLCSDCCCVGDSLTPLCLRPATNNMFLVRCQISKTLLWNLGLVMLLFRSFCPQGPRTSLLPCLPHAEYLSLALLTWNSNGLSVH